MSRYSVVTWDCSCGGPAVDSHSIVDTLEYAEELAREETPPLYPGSHSTIYEIIARAHESKPHELLAPIDTVWPTSFTVFAWLGSEDSNGLFEVVDDVHTDQLEDIIDQCCQTKNAEFGEIFFLITRPKVTYRNPPMERVEL